MTDEVGTEPIVHIITREEWETTPDDEWLRPDSLQNEGFAHCSAPHQVPAVADALFGGRDDLLLIVIDPSRLAADVVWEDCYETGQEYPHVYGPVDRRAIVAVLPYAPDPTGTFTEPDLDWVG